MTDVLLLRTAAFDDLLLAQQVVRPGQFEFGLVIARSLLQRVNRVLGIFQIIGPLRGKKKQGAAIESSWRAADLQASIFSPVLR